jgi:hypothetical protein
MSARVHFKINDNKERENKVTNYIFSYLNSNFNVFWSNIRLLTCLQALKQVLKNKMSQGGEGTHKSSLNC